MNTKFATVLVIVIRMFVGSMMIWGGSQKFLKPIPSPTERIEKQYKEGTVTLKQNVDVLKIKNYIFGLKQTNYFWQLLAICELLFGLLIISQYAGFIGAVLLTPITINIFLFHVFLEPHDTAELIQTGLLLLANILLIANEYPKWKHLVWIKPL